MAGKIGDQKKNVILLVSGLLIFWLILTATIQVYEIDTVTQIQKRILQNVVYAVILALTFVLMKCTKKPFLQFGLSVKKIHLQILVGILAGAALILFTLMLGSVPSIPKNFCYAVLSQALVGISEESFFRGFVLHTVKEITASKDLAVFLSSLFFALIHFPLSHSIAQVIVTFIVGAFFAVLHTEFEDTIGIPALAIAHALSNIF